MRRLVLVGVLAVVLVLTMAVPALAKNDKAQAKNGDANGKGKLVLNITYKTKNQPDSGLSGYWALDALNRHVQVREAGDGSYYVIVKDQGKWSTSAGVTSPGDQAVAEGADASGPMHGGYAATFESDGIIDGATNGHIGTFDYGGDLEGNAPGAFNWLTTYFPVNSGLTYVDWAWTYMFKNQSWVNAMAGNSGDIVIP
jgi:hypothetical protein